MPWRECNVMDERVKFVARLLEGEKMAALCREFDISRKTCPRWLFRVPQKPAKDAFLLTSA